MFLLISPSTRCLEYPIAPAAYDWNLYLRNNFDDKMHFNSCRVFLLFLVSLYLSLSPLTMFDEKVTFFSIPLKHF